MKMFPVSLTGNRDIVVQRSLLVEWMLDFLVFLQFVGVNDAR